MAIVYTQTLDTSINVFYWRLWKWNKSCRRIFCFSTVIVWQYGKQWPSCLSEYWRKAQESRKWEGRVIIRDVNQIPSYWGLSAGLCWDQMWVKWNLPYIIWSSNPKTTILPTLNPPPFFLSLFLSPTHKNIHTCFIY